MENRFCNGYEYHEPEITICTECANLGDKFSFPLPNNLIDMDVENPFIKHYYCCCGDCDMYKKDITGILIKNCEWFQEW